MKTIIIIDDNEIDQLIIQKMLESHLSQFFFHHFLSASAALAALKEDGLTASLILLDIDMPLMNGWDFINELGRLDISIPVYILTCSLSESDRQKSMENPLIKGFFNKPMLNESIVKLAIENNLS